MRRFAAVAVLCSGAVLAVFLFACARPALAADKPICLCSCVDTSETNTYPRLPSITPGTRADCQNNVCDAACGEQKSVQTTSTTDYNTTSTNRCLCSCVSTSKSNVYTNLASGATDCTGSCASACGGSANLDPAPNSQQLKFAPCVPGHPEDCATGGFGIYEGIACALRLTTEQGWPNSQKPACIVPITTKNAKLECQHYGGIAKGGDCGEIGTGESPDSYLKSRALFGKTGEDFPGPYSTLSAWNAALDTRVPDIKIIPEGAGICYQLGAIYGTSGYLSEPTNETPEVGVPSNKFVCLKKKQNTCGSVPFPTDITPGSGRYYKCMLPDEYLSGASKVDPTLQKCFPPSYTDVCASLPSEYRCCPTKIGGCYTDGECGNGQVCEGADPLKLVKGTCIISPYCETDDKTRVCRNATEIEKSTPSICTLDTLVSLGRSRCFRPYETCCKPANPKALSACAIDKYYDQALDQSKKDIWLDFVCTDAKDIPPQEWAGNTLAIFPYNEQEYLDRTSVQTGNCLTSDVIRPGTTSAASRCAPGKFCCNYTALKYEGGVASLSVSFAGRSPSGWACSPNPKTADDPNSQFKCYKRTDFEGASNDVAIQQGFANSAEMLKTLASSQGCIVTPITSDIDGILQNKECQEQEICCLRAYADSGGGLDREKLCNTDEACNPPSSGCDPNTNPGACRKCDLSTHLCVTDDELMSKANTSGSCFLRAAAKGENGQSIADTTGIKTEQFTCQAVLASATNAEGKCLQSGCEDLNASGNVPEGSSFKCCIPGIGAAPGAAAKAAAKAVAVPKSPFSLWLPSCVTSDVKCTLDDIVMTGAAFANFLIAISGSIFLAIFVYGGFLYLTAGSSDRAAKGKKTILQATYAIALMMGAFIFISFIQSSLVGAGSTCGKDAATANHMCTLIPVDPSDKKALDAAISEKKCVRGKCKGPANFLCCPM